MDEALAIQEEFEAVIDERGGDEDAAKEEMRQRVLAGLVSKDAAAELLALQCISLQEYKRCETYIEERKEREAAALAAVAQAKQEAIAASIKEEARRALESSSDDDDESSSEEDDGSSGGEGEDGSDEEETDSEEEWLRNLVSPEERRRREEAEKAERMKLRNREALTAEMIGAAASGNIDLVREILTTVGPAEVKDSRIRALPSASISEAWNGVSVLMAASRYGQDEVVAMLLSEEIACSAELGDGEGITALMWAARAGHSSTCDALRKGGCDTNAVDLQHRTALVHAAVAGQYAVVQNLAYTDGIDLNCGDTAGATALMHAADLGHTDIVKSLAGQDDCDVDKGDKGRRTALMRAARWGHIQCLRLLLNEDADTDLRDRRGWTALMFAARWNKIHAARMLVEEAEAELNTRERATGRTALMLTASRGHTDMVKLLLSAGADSHVRDIYGNSALELAVDVELVAAIEEHQTATAPSEDEEGDDGESDEDEESVFSDD